VRQVSPSADVMYIRYSLHMHNVVSSVVCIINLLQTAQCCVYNIGVIAIATSSLAEMLGN